MKKGIFIYRHAALYRYPIYSKIDKEFDAKFCFCGQPKMKLRMLDYSKLSNVDLSLKEINFPFGFYYLKGTLNLAIKEYDYVFIAGDIRDISSWALLFKCFILNKDIYFWTHAWYGKESLLLRKIKKLYYSLGKGTFLYGNYARDLMIKEGLDAKKLYVIYNSLDYEKQFALRSSLNQTDIYKSIFNNGYPVLIFVGRLEIYKKLDYILTAQSRLLMQNIKLNMIFVGDGVEKQTLKDLTNKLHLNESVCFYGPCYDETILSELIHNADICVSPGNIGLTAIHALVYGTPVITHNSFPYQGPEFEAIIDGITGAFFDYGSIDSLTETIKKWLDFHPIKTDELVNECYKVIDSKYNPYYQINLLKETLR